MKIDWSVPVLVIQRPIMMALLFPMPLLFSGCMSTHTAHRAIHGEHNYQQVRITRVEKVVLIPEDKLIALFEGKIAGAARAGRFTLTASLPRSNDVSLIGSRAVDPVFVPPSAVTEGWHLPESSGLQQVAVVFPLVLAGYGSLFDKPDTFPGLKGAERTLYVVTSENSTIEVGLVYVVQDAPPRKTFFTLQPQMETRGPQYAFLLLLPFTVAVDLATLPVQIIFLWNLPH